MILLTSNATLNKDPIFVDPDEIALIVENSANAAISTAVVIKAGNAVTVHETAQQVYDLIAKAKADGSDAK